MKKTKLTDGREKENEALKEIFNKKKKELGLTQAILAEKLDVSQGAVNMYLNSINPLNTPIASRFAELLNVPVSDFSPRLAAEIERMAQTIASTTMQVSHSTLKDRLIYAREQKGISQEQLGKAINKSQSAIAALETGRNQGSTNIAKIAEILGVSAIWLETGQGEMYSNTPIPFDNNVNLSLKHILHRIPVISWVQAGCWRGIEYYRDDDLEYIEITTDIKDGFGLRVQGDSMMPEFAQGDIIVVAPHAQPENGSYVVVVQDDKATFKKLVYDGTTPYLKPLNPQYPMLSWDESTRIVGVVKQKIKTY